MGDFCVVTHCQEEALKYAAEAKRLEQEVQSLRVSCRAALRRAAMLRLVHHSQLHT